MLWWQEKVFYQIYPLGFCGAERQNDFGAVRHRLNLIEDELPRLQDMGIGALLLNPLFQSAAHGYDTADFYNTDCRLGDNADLKRFVKRCHDCGIKVVLDGVFNHVGREFPQFKDVAEKKWDSPYKDWFHIDFNGNGAYNDGFYYEGWEGHYELVKLNLHNEAVRNFLFDAVRFYIDEFDIDGLRLDVCYGLPEDFIRDLSGVCKSKKNDFFLAAEAIHGDYNRLLNCGVDSVTNYECYKGLYSAINSKNLFEIEHSLSRQFANTPWSLYKGRHLLNFADNHDVPRLYSVLSDKRNAAAAYAILFAMPGIPCIYYGSEYAAEGVKGDGDVHLRPKMSDVDRNKNTELTDILKKLISLKNTRDSLKIGDYEKVTLNNEYFAIRRACGEEKTVLAVNISDNAVTVDTAGNVVDLIDGRNENGRAEVPPHSFRIFG